MKHGHTKRGREWLSILAVLFLVSGCSRELLPAGRPEIAEPETAREETAARAELLEEEKLLCVHVCGSVVAPGIYYLPEGARRMDAVKAAGGLAAGADSEACNLAERLFDGEQVRVPFKAENRDPPSETVWRKTERINLNTAGKEELMQLPGIGEVRAEAILRYREREGPFTSTEDILQVSGIGKAAYEKIRTLIRV